MRAAGVDRAVLVPPFFEGYRNDFAVACASEAPESFRVMARVDLRTGDPGPVRELLRDPVVAGVRLVFLPADAGRVDDPGAEWLWAFAEAEDVPVMLLASGQLGALGDLARRRPGLRLAVDHLGLTGRATDAAAAPEIEELAGLAVLSAVAGAGLLVALLGAPAPPAGALVLGLLAGIANGLALLAMFECARHLRLSV